MPEKKADCYKCKWRRDIPGDAHSRCAHPILERIVLKEHFLVRMVIMMGFPASAFSGVDIMEAAGVKAEPHGVRNGWFNWPYNFDPVWLLECRLYEEVEEDGGEGE